MQWRFLVLRFSVSHSSESLTPCNFGGQLTSLLVFFLFKISPNNFRNVTLSGFNKAEILSASTNRLLQILGSTLSNCFNQFIRVFWKLIHVYTVNDSSLTRAQTKFANERRMMLPEKVFGYDIFSSMYGGLTKLSGIVYITMLTGSRFKFNGNCIKLKFKKLF